MSRKEKGKFIEKKKKLNKNKKIKYEGRQK